MERLIFFVERSFIGREVASRNKITSEQCWYPRRPPGRQVSSKRSAREAGETHFLKRIWWRVREAIRPSGPSRASIGIGRERDRDRDSVRVHSYTWLIPSGNVRGMRESCPRVSHCHLSGGMSEYLQQRLLFKKPKKTTKNVFFLE